MNLDKAEVTNGLFGIVIFSFLPLSVLVKDWVSLVYAIFVLAGILFAIREWKNISQQEKRLILGFGIFTLLVALSFITSDDMRAAFRHFEKYLSFLFAGFIYLFLKQKRFNYNQYLLASMLMAPLAWMTYYFFFETRERLSGAYYAIFVGDMAILLACLAVVYWLTCASKTIHKLFAIIVIILSLTVSILSETRGALLYLPVFMLLVIYLHRKTIPLTAWILAVVLITASVISIFIFEPSDLGRASIASEVQEYENNPSEYSSVGVRIHMWSDSLKMFLESPLVGIGVGDYREETQALLDAGQSSIPVVYGHPHNIFLNMLATTGISGFLGLVIAIIGYPLVLFTRAWRRATTPEQKFYSLSGIVVITAFIIFGVTESWISRNPLVRSYIMLLFLFLVPVSSLVYQKRND